MSRNRHREVRIGAMRMTIPSSWRDITETVETESPPFTLAKEDGVGALQLTVGEYRSGPMPGPTASDLGDMLDEFAAARTLGRPIRGSRVLQEGPPSSATANYHSEPDLARAWYISAKGHFVLVTYVCDWDHRGAEEAEVNSMVRSVRFSARERK